MPMSRGVLRTAGMPSVAKSMTCSAPTGKLSWPRVPVVGRDFIGRAVVATSAEPPREPPPVIRQSLRRGHFPEVGRAVSAFGPVRGVTALRTRDSTAAISFNSVRSSFDRRQRVVVHDHRGTLVGPFVAHGLVSELQVVFQGAV